MEILATPEVQRDLQAALGARSELGLGMEDHVIEAFLDKIDTRIQARIDAAVANSKAAAPKKHLDPTELAVPSFALAIPLVAIAGGMVGGWGIAAVMACVFAVNVLYMIYGLLAP